MLLSVNNLMIYAQSENLQMNRHKFVGMENGWKIDWVLAVSECSDEQSFQYIIVMNGVG